jgi:tetratricopeptide (TPR) repeat protein
MKPGRNDGCPCGSGRKFKRCCGSSGSSSGRAAPVSPEAQAVLQLAERLLRDRRYAEAIGPLEHATRLMPDSAALFNDLGMACLFARRLPEAIGHLRRSATLRPGASGTYYNLGIALDQAGDVPAALEALRRCVSLDPGLAEAHALAGDLLVGTGQREEAVSAYERASRASPGTTLGRLCAARALVLRERPQEAEAWLRQLIARDGSCAEAHLMLGQILSDAGRFDEASASFERTLALDPSNGAAYHGLVSSKRLTEADWPLVARITTLAAAGSSQQQMTLHFAAGKAKDDLGDYAGAVVHFDEANRIRRRIARFDRAEFERRVDGLIARYTRDFFREHAQLGADDETPVLVLGMPRSGTTLIERIVASHPRVAGAGELRFWRERGGDAVDADPASLARNADRLRGDYLRLLRSIGPESVRVTDKMPFNFLWLGLVHLLLPRARIIHCRRNPVDTCLSIYQTQFSQSWSFASDRGDLAAYYRQYLRLMDHWRAVLPPRALLEVDYEEATSAPGAIARRLVEFCGLEWSEACLEPERNPDAVRTANKWQARQPVYRTSVERWRHYAPWLGELRTLLPASGQQG